MKGQGKKKKSIYLSSSPCLIFQVFWICKGIYKCNYLHFFLKYCLGRIHMIILTIGYFSEDSGVSYTDCSHCYNGHGKAIVPFHTVCIQEDVAGQYLNSQDDKRSMKVHRRSRMMKEPERFSFCETELSVWYLSYPRVFCSLWEVRKWEKWVHICKLPGTLSKYHFQTSWKTQHPPYSC